MNRPTYPFLDPMPEQMTNEQLLASVPKMAKDVDITSMTNHTLACWTEYLRRNMLGPHSDDPIVYEGAVKLQVLPELIRRLAVSHYEPLAVDLRGCVNDLRVILEKGYIDRGDVLVLGALNRAAVAMDIAAQRVEFPSFPIEALEIWGIKLAQLIASKERNEITAIRMLIDLATIRDGIKNLVNEYRGKH